jgi:hypothetical protein
LFNNTTDRGNNSLEPTIVVPAPPVRTTLGYVRSRISKLKQELVQVEKKLPAEQKVWERHMAGKTSVWTSLHLTNAISTGGSSYTNLPDHSLLATGVNPIYDTITVEAETGLTGITAVLLEVLPDPSLPKRPAYAVGSISNMILDEFAAWAVPNSGGVAGPRTLFSRGHAIGSNNITAPSTRLIAIQKRVGPSGRSLASAIS